MNARALAEQLGPARGAFDVDGAEAALASYLSGRSVRLAQRDSGVPERAIDRWIVQLGLKRSRAATIALKTQALTTGGELSAQVRRTVGAL